MPDAFDSLISYFGQSPKTPGASSADIAKYILLNAKNAKPIGPGMLAKNEPSLMGRLFDVLSRPNYAVANSALEMQRGTFDPGDFFEGLSGKKKTTFSKVLEEGGMPKGPLSASLGFVADVALDPTTYIPVAGIASKLGSKFGKAALKGGNVLEDLPLGEQMLRKGDPVIPENYGLDPLAPQAPPKALAGGVEPFELPTPNILTPKSGFTQPQLELDLGLPPRIKVPEPDSPPVGLQKVSEELPGQIPFRFPGFNVKKEREAAQIFKMDNATNIVNKVSQGDINEALKLVPPPPPKITPAVQRVADSIVAKFNPDTASAAINKQFPDTLNAQQQAKLWQQAKDLASKNVRKLNPKTKLPRPKDKIQQDITNQAIPIYKAIENRFVEQGKVPRIGTGDNVRLSDVINDLVVRGVPVTDDVVREFSTKISSSSEVGSAVERLRARGAVSDSVKVKSVVEKISDSKAQLDSSNMFSDARVKEFEKFFKKFGKTAAEASGISPAGVRATGSLLDSIIKSGKTSAQLAIEQKSKILDEIVANGRISSAAVNNSLTRGLEKDLGKIPTWATNDNKAVEFLMARVATWWGQRDLRPISLNSIGSAAATAEARGKVLNNLFTSFDLPQRSEAFRLAQGIGTPSNPQIEMLSGQIARIMSDLTGQASGSSVLLRSAVNIDSLNKWMKKYGTGFQFAKSTLTHPITGDVIDFSKGTDWLSSWKAADLRDQDPATFIFKTMQALEQSTREKALFDEIGERFGSRVAGKSFRTKVDGHPYISQYFFPQDIAKQIPRVIADWTPGTVSNNKLLGLYDRVLSMWKSGVTIYRPAHHVRNMIGDVYMGALDGVTSVKPYRLAVQVQRSMTGSYQTMFDIDRLVEIGAASKYLATPMPGKTLFRNKSGVPFTAEQIAAVAHQKGLLEHVRTLEDIIDMGDQGAKGISITRPFGGKVQKLARGASELQSHNGRLAHFIDKIMKSRGSNLPEIFEEASRRARKFHPSGLDLTQFEKTVFRRIIPFYSWIRKSTPVLLEGIVMKPGITVLPSKLNQAIQDAQGIETPGRDNPFPVDQLFPEWIRNQGVGPIGLPDDGILGKLSNQIPAGYVMGGVGLNPLAELVSQIQEPGRTVTSSLTPAIQIPMELATGEKMFTNEPFLGDEAKPGAFNQYLGEKIPVFSGIQGITGITPFGTETSKSIKSGDDASREALVNWLTGAGIKGTGPYIKSARFERTNPLRVEKKAKKDAFLSELRERMGE